MKYLAVDNVNAAGHAGAIDNDKGRQGTLATSNPIKGGRLAWRMHLTQQ